MAFSQLKAKKIQQVLASKLIKDTEFEILHSIGKNLKERVQGFGSIVVSGKGGEYATETDKC